MSATLMSESVSQAQVNGLVEEVFPQECRGDYAEAAIPEYWIVDPETETITVLALGDAGYVTHGVYGRGDRASSPALPGFAVDSGDVFDAAGGE